MVKKTKRPQKWVIVNHNQVGTHLIIEFWNGKIIDNSKEIEEILITAAKKSKNTPLATKIHKFLPQGITGVILLAESHIALHVWPEKNYVAIDIFTCGKKSEPKKALEYLREKFQPKKVRIIQLERGIWKQN